MARSPLSLEERFWQKVDLGNPDGCDLWTGHRNRHGYGVFRVGPRLILAHRFAWALEEPIPADMQVLHRCDNPPCVNRAHLFLGTPKDNAEDREHKGRGHQRGNPGAEHPLAKLTADQVAAIRLAYASGLVTQKELAAEFGVSQGHISHIIGGKRWNDDALQVS